VKSTFISLYDFNTSYVAGHYTKTSPPPRAVSETPIKELEPTISEPTMTFPENLLITSPDSCVAFVEGKVSSKQILLISRISYNVTRFNIAKVEIVAFFSHISDNLFHKDYAY
jgi:hypothetical protein